MVQGVPCAADAVSKLRQVPAARCRARQPGATPPVPFT